MKPYVKFASTLVTLGIGLFALERFGLAELRGSAGQMHLDGTILSILVLAPFLLIIAGALVFMVGRMRRL